MQVEKTGYNINNKIDTVQTGNNIIDWFYNFWKIEPNKLVESNFIRPYTKFQYKNIIYDYHDFLNFLISSKENGTVNNMQIIQKQVMPSGSRRLDILISGYIVKEGKRVSAFSQYFLIVSDPKTPDNWFLQNTILNEFE